MSTSAFIKINREDCRFEDSKNTAKQLKSFIFARLGKVK